MSFLDQDKQALMGRLEVKGMAKGAILGFIWSLKSCVLDNPEMNHRQIEKRLQYLGWNDIELDDETFQLAIECFKIDGLGTAGDYAYSM